MYRATIGGAFGGGAGPATAHPIDAGSIIDAITNGASSLIQNAYMRKQAEAGQADKQAQRAQEEKRYTDTIARDEQRYNQQRADKAADLERQGVKDAYQREFDARKLESENLKAGITPGRTTITREPEAVAPIPSIASSFQSADLSAGGPATPSPLTTRPSLGTIPRLNISSTPDQFTPKPTAQQHVVDPVTGEVRFFDPTKPPVGMRLNTIPRKDPNGAPGLTPVQANQVKLQQSALLNMNKAVAELQKAVKEGGMALMPGAYRQKIASLQANAMIQFKEAANLGALSGPDMGLVEGALGNATSYSQLFRGRGDGVLSALKSAQQSLEARARTMETVYGVKMPAPLVMDPDGDDAHPATPDIDALIKAGKTDEQIKVILKASAKP